ncbi:MAG: DUF2142 domain-containing protein [Anaerolineae bacterium]|nr:DUF2142 domain-containing protein [Anaerolineae bacterium]
MRRFSRYDVAALLIALGFIVIAIAYSRATPIFEPPDEGAHFLYAHNILVEGHLPLLEDRASVFASQSTQRHHMPLYYLIGAVLISGTDRSDIADFLHQSPLASTGVVTLNNQNLNLHPLDLSPDKTMRAVFILRAFSIVLAIGTLLLIYHGVSLLFSKRVGVAAMLLTASIPTFIFISASISNDNLTTFLFTAGVVWCIHAWRNARLNLRDAALIGVILGGIALSKHNGLALFGVVGVVVIAGIIVRRWTWSAGLRTLAIAGALAAVLAGWWYLRNLQLYGDLLAIGASAAIWGRGNSINVLPRGVLAEAQGIYYSFWMTLGYLNVTGPSWLFPYTFIVVIGALIGAVRLLRRAIRQRQDDLLFAIGLCALVIAAVIAAQIVTTRQIASSQGRILFPGLLAFSAVIVVGWRALIPPRWAPLLILPVAAAALTGPTVYLAEAYRPLTVVDALPASAHPIDAAAEGLDLVGYELDRPTAAPGEIVTGALYFTGSHPEDPRMILRAVDPRTGEPVGGAEFYPGMIPTSTLDPDRIYRAPFRLKLDDAETPQPPVRLGLLIDWRTVADNDPSQGRYLTWDAGTFPVLNAWTRIDPAYRADPPAVAQTVTFGGLIRLDGYTLTPDGITLVWRALGPLPTDYRLTLGAFNSAGHVVFQADGEVAGFPTSAWVADLAFEDAHALDLPPNAETIFLGWYDVDSGQRLPADPNPRGDDLWVIGVEG